MPQDTLVSASANAKSAIGFSGIVALVVGFLLCAVESLIWSHGVLSAEAIGYTIGSPLIPALVAYAIAGRKSKRNWNRFSVWFAVVALAFLLLALGSPRP